jgi:hypothetical protein
VLTRQRQGCVDIAIVLDDNTASFAVHHDDVMGLLRASGQRDAKCHCSDEAGPVFHQSSALAAAWRLDRRLSTLSRRAVLP